MDFRKWRTAASFCGELEAVIHCALQGADCCAEAIETATTKRAEILLNTREIVHLTERCGKRISLCGLGLEFRDANAEKSACSRTASFT